MDFMEARNYLGRKYRIGEKVMKVASIHMEVPGYPWGWMVNVKKPMDQARFPIKGLEESMRVP